MGQRQGTVKLEWSKAAAALALSSISTPLMVLSVLGGFVSPAMASAPGASETAAKQATLNPSGIVSRPERSVGVRPERSVGGQSRSILRKLPKAQVETVAEVQPAEHNPSALTETQQIRLVLTLSERRLDVYEGDRISVSYPVAVGREGWLTPTGEFTVFQKQADPAWEHPLTGEVVAPGPQNPLGSRWIGFWTDGTNSIGFHGTPDESVIGSAVSHGCVRMRNDDVLALYDYIGVETPVTVLP